MRTALTLLMGAAISISAGFMVIEKQQPPADRRTKAKQLYDEGNFNEAFLIYQSLAVDPATSGNIASDDLGNAVDCLSHLSRFAETDLLIEDSIAAHRDDFRLLQRAARIYREVIPHDGFIIAGQFERGGHRGGGQWANSAARDRVRSVQLLLGAISLAENDASATVKERADLWQSLADLIGQNRFTDAWKLQDLTEIKDLPDVEISEQMGPVFGFGGFSRRGMGWGRPSKGAPVDADGNPVFHHVPDSWGAAKSDGERWRWAMKQVIGLDPSRRSQMELTWAEFLQSQFGVSAAVVGGPPVIRPLSDTDREDDRPEEAGIRDAHRLKDSETIARLATGTRRFELPDEFNHIAILKTIITREDNEKRRALESLIDERMNRHQYPQAATLLRELHTLAQPGDDKKSVQDRIDQIEKNWLQIESSSVQPSGRGATLEIRYRNGRQVTFEARPIRIESLLRDVRQYLESRPAELSYEKLQIDNIGWMLIRDNESRYLDPPVAKWELPLTPPAEHFDATLSVTTPLQKSGAWWVSAKMQDGNESRIVLWVADTAITRKRVEEGTMYFVADAVTGAPVERAELEFFGWRQEYRQNRRHEIFTSRFAARTDAQGMVSPNPRDLIPNNQWITIARTKEGRLAFHGFAGVWNPEKLRPLEYSPLKVYAITDRPVYRPGHTVKYRLWTRKPRFDFDDNSYADKSCWVQIRNPKGDVVHEVRATTDRWAGVDGEWTLPDDCTLGDYSIGIAEEVPMPGQADKTEVSPPESQKRLLGVGSFAVEEYRKPEYEVNVEAPEEPVRLGDRIQAKVIAKYYFGAPVSGATVHYKVERTHQDSRWYPVARWDWLYSPGYWWFAPEYDWYPGFRSWGCAAPVRPWWNWSPDPPEIVAEGDATLGEDGTFPIDIDTAVAMASHSDSDHRYNITAEVVDKSRRTIIGNGSVIVARSPFRVFVWTDNGHYQSGDTVSVGFQARTPDGRPVRSSGRLILNSITYENGRPGERELQSWDVETGQDGSGNLKLHIPDSGQYRITVRLKDPKGHEVEGGYVFYVRGSGNDGRDFRFNDLELITDRKEYSPGESVRLQINTNRADSTVLLFVRPMNGLCARPIVLRLKGKSTVYDIPIERQDMPNIFVEAVTISDGRIHSEIREIAVPPEQRITNVDVKAGADRYRPGETADVKLRLTDLNGTPISGNVVVSAYDAGLDYVAASRIPEIRSFFWDVRRHHHLHLDSSLQRISGPVYRDGEIPMQPLFGNAPGMRGGAFLGDAAYGFGGRRRMTRGLQADVFFPESAAPAAMGEMSAGAPMSDALSFNPVPREALAKAAGGGIAAAAEPVIRSAFLDTAFWSASSVADNNGEVSVSFVLPDNLTTWKIQAWAMGDGTRVGSGASEIICSKNLIIRPQTPRFFTERDQIVLSAVVHNYLSSEKSVRVEFENEGEHLKLLSESGQTVSIPANGESRIDWLVDVAGSGLTKIRMKAFTDEESDAVEVQVPVQVHGMLKTESFTGVIRPDGDRSVLNVHVPADRIPGQSRLEVRYSPSLAGAMVDSLPYLLQYPYGCTEQTLNRFLPAVLTQRTLLRMGVSLADIRNQRSVLDSQRTYRGKFPAHWGQPPEIQTRDIRELPAGFGQGSSTLAEWIQDHINRDAKQMRGLSADFNPVFDDEEMNRIVAEGVRTLTEMQLSDGGWGWFSGFGERSSPHITAQVVHGLSLAQSNDVPVVPDMIPRGVEWLKNYQAAEIAKLREGDKRRADEKYRGRPDHKMAADNLDAFVAMVLAEHAATDPAMTDYLFRDRGQMTVYGLSLTGMVLHRSNDGERRDLVMRNIEQFLVQDEENQTAWLRLPENSWWYWYGSDNEAMAVYLKLLVAVRPEEETASRLVKYLLNNRKHGTRWNSTRDTAMVVESMAEYIRATGEDQPDMTVEVLIDGEVQKAIRITAENLFSFDNQVLLEGDAVTTGAHRIEIRRQGKGAVYFSAYLSNFSTETSITSAGLEVKVERRFYRLERDDRQISVQGDRGQVVGQTVAKYRRIPLENLQAVRSGDLIEVEMVIDSKNDYEYLMLEDHKPSGFEPDDQRSGYVQEGLRAYRELRDSRVSFFLTSLARGNHSISYRLRAEIPGTVAALPATIEGMYAPELIGNSAEQKLKVIDRN